MRNLGKGILKWNLDESNKLIYIHLMLYINLNLKSRSNFPSPSTISGKSFNTSL